MDAKKILGLAVRAQREALKLSQERLAERAGITYQYLSALENGRENFTIGVLESLASALGTNLPDLVVAAYGHTEPDADFPRIDRRFLRTVPLPAGLTLSHLAGALDETQRVIRLLNQSLVRAGGRALPSYIQANNFSGIVSNILSDSFDRLTPFKHNHDQRYPDLINKDKDGNEIAGLEVKSTIQVKKGGESHNGHSGWHVIACFKLDSATGDIRFIHVMFADLIGHTEKDSDWKYVGSTVNTESGSQRTETYNTTGIGTTKLRDGSAYLDTDEISFSRWRQQRRGPVPKFSIFHPENSKA
ncbi:MAG TPA: helix-turn-helix domain-containing protein [Verrucomicrobiales bacterium]|nr:helix-turn-helix domain-containing protein [Akkermansiaceae bacterium]HRX57019.1 helix-turn-helix domain-containing protein [Verrucomicrobiales bacterium]